MVGIGLAGLLEYLKLLVYLKFLASLVPSASLTTLFVVCLKAYGISVVLLLWKGIYRMMDILTEKRKKGSQVHFCSVHFIS